ncbi:MAG: hypothetical protein AAGA92_08770 [Planctomycetota bacterium]
MHTRETASAANAPKAVLEDTPTTLQYKEFGAAAIGGCLAALLCRMGNGDPWYYALAGAVAIAGIVGAFAVHYAFGGHATLEHFVDRLVLTEKGETRVIPLDQLKGFSTSWSDVYVNGSYTLSRVKFFFKVAGSSRIHQYDSSGSRGTPKYDELRALESAVSEVVARRMREDLLAKGSAPWTAQLKITTAGIEYQEDGAAETERIPFHELGDWGVADGVFKLSPGDWRTLVTEPISQTNFLPGLTLFAQLHAEFGDRREFVEAAQS